MLGEHMPDLPEPEPDEMFSNMVIDLTNPYKDIEFVAQLKVFVFLCLGKRWAD